MRADFDGFIAPGSREESLLSEIDFDNIPRHVAVIMDGNGRWARKRGLPRIEGHIAASKSVREIVESGARLGIEVLSLYAFSTENWRRPKREVDRLWKLLRDYLRKEDRALVKHNLRLRVIGQREGIPRPVLEEIERVEELTRGNGRMTVVLALNYGGRTEIVDAVRRLLRDKEALSARLYTEGLPDPDLLIRTSGEFRISNFLLWQIAYAELLITPVLWPDFKTIDLLRAVLDYQKRDRRFGDVQSRKGLPA
jgi:undecaprenyl diphosphate synthase